MATPLHVEIGLRLRSARERAGMTQDQLAGAIRIETATLSRYETGRSPVSLEVLERAATALSIEPEELLARTGQERSELRGDEAALLATYRSLPPSMRKIALRLVRVLRQSG